MSQFDFVTIKIELADLENKNTHHVYQQTIPLSVLDYNCKTWLQTIIATVNKLEVNHV